MPKAVRQQHEVVEMHIIEADMIKPKEDIEELSGPSNHHSGSESHRSVRPPRPTHIQRWTILKESSETHCSFETRQVEACSSPVSRTLLCCVNHPSIICAGTEGLSRNLTYQACARARMAGESRHLLS